MVGLLDAGDLDGALRAGLQALRLFERHSGKRHPDVVNVLTELASVAQQQGEFARGLRWARRAVDIITRIRTRDDVVDQLRALALRRLGNLHVARGEYGPAAMASRRALRIARKSLGSSDVAGALNDLAIVCKYTARFDEAGRLYREALRLTTRAGGADARVATILHNLGGLEHARGRFSRGEPYARKSVVLRERAVGRMHPDVAADAAALAAILHGLCARSKERSAASRYEREAASLYRRALRIFATSFGDRHVEVGFNLGQLAALHQLRGAVAKADRLYAQALPIQRETFGPRHPQLALTLTNLSELRMAQGRSDEARACLKEALSIYRRARGPGHPDSLDCAKRLSLLAAAGEGRKRNTRPTGRRVRSIVHPSKQGYRRRP
jgi:tetratricopeptide (TPR) repeat protein